MARTKPQRQLLTVPFAKGLSQKADPRELQLGPALQVTNYVADKGGALTKGPGYALMANPRATTTGRAVAQNRTTLLAVGGVTVAPNNRVQDRLYAVNQSTLPLLPLAAMPEAVSVTPTVIAGSTGLIASSDMAINAAQGDIELYVWEVAGVIYYALYIFNTEGTFGTKTCLVQPQPHPCLNPAFIGKANYLFHAPKVIPGGLTGLEWVVTAMTVDTTGTDPPQIWASTFRSPDGTFVTSVKTATLNIGNSATTYPYDIAAVEDDTTHYLLIYQGSGGGHSTINVSRLLMHDNSTTTSGVFVDATWAGAGYPNLTGMCVRGDANGCYFAYGYNQSNYPASGTTVNIAGTPAVFGGGLTMPGLGSSICSIINLYGGSSTNAMPPGPQLMDIRAVAGTSPLQQQVVWSPGPEPVLTGSVAKNTLGGAPGTGIPMGLNRLNITPPPGDQSGCPYAAIYQSIFYAAAGTGTYGASSFRWTNGVTLASRMFIGAPAANNCYMAGYVPSHNWIPTVTPTGQATSDFTYTSPQSAHTYNNLQGSFFLFSMDTFGDITTAQATFISGTLAGTNVPMRWVASIAPRQALSQSPITSSALPHMVAGFYSYTSAGACFQSTLLTSTSATQNDVSNCMFAVSPIPGFSGQTGQYQRDELGGLTAFSAGVPALTDGRTVEEFAFPYYPENLQADAPYNGIGNTGQLLPGTYQYMVLYERTDSTGAVHRSGRSVPITVTVPSRTIPWIPFPGAGSVDFLDNGLGQYTDDGGRTYTIYYSSVNPLFTATMASQGAQTISFSLLNPGNNQVTVVTYPIVGFGDANHITILVNNASLPNISTALTVSFPSQYQVTIHAPCVGYSLSQNGDPNFSQSPITLKLYRTLSNGSIFYYTGISATNSVTRAYVDLTDVTYDGDIGLVSSGDYVNLTISPDGFVGVPFVPANPGIATNPEIYGDGNTSTTPGAILDNLTPPSFGGLVVHKNRWWGFSGKNVWYSKALTTGEGPGFNEVQAFSVDDGPLDVTALASLDERLIIFKRDRLFYVTGDGPDDTGANNDLQPPQRIVSDAGCVNNLSVITGPMGVWFQSDNGLYLLNRKMMVEPAGKNVEDLLATYPILTSANIDMAHGRIIWTANNGSIGALIIYDYVMDVWSTQQLNGGALTFASATLALQAKPWLIGYDAAGHLWQEQTSSFAIAATYQNGAWQSPWIKAEDLQGFAHWWMVNLMWVNNDPHALTIQIAYDYSASALDTYTVTATQMAAATTPEMQWRFQPSRSKAQAIQVTITDAQDGVTAPVTFQGPTLLSLVVEYGIKASRAYGPVAQRN